MYGDCHLVQNSVPIDIMFSVKINSMQNGMEGTWLIHHYYTAMRKLLYTVIRGVPVTHPVWCSISVDFEHFVSLYIVDYL